MISAGFLRQALVAQFSACFVATSALACVALGSTNAEICPPSTDWRVVETQGDRSLVTLELNEESGVTRRILLSIAKDPQNITMPDDDWAALERTFSAVNVSMLESRYTGASIFEKSVHERFGFGAATVSGRIQSDEIAIIATSTMGFPKRALLFLETARIGEEIVVEPEDDAFHETALGWLRIDEAALGWLRIDGESIIR